MKVRLRLYMFCLRKQYAVLGVTGYFVKWNVLIIENDSSL